jgi:RND superfamily putative drug exporter
VAALLYRVGVFSARHRVSFVLGWVSLVIWLAAGAVGGVTAITGNSSQADQFFKIPGAESSTALETLQRDFPSLAGSADGKTMSLVLQAPAAELITTPDNIGKVLSIVARAGSLEHVASVANPLNPDQPYVSPDQTTAVVVLTLRGVTDANASQIQSAVAGLADQARQAGFTAEVGGQIRTDEISLLGPIEAIGAGVAFLVLLVALGSLVAAGLNMFTALVGVGTGVLGAFAYSVLVKPIGSMTPALAVMLGLALGIDYGLFIITRFRAE